VAQWLGRQSLAIRLSPHLSLNYG